MMFGEAKLARRLWRRLILPRERGFAQRRSHKPALPILTWPAVHPVFTFPLYYFSISQVREEIIMNRNTKRALGISLLLISALAFGLVAQQMGGPQGEGERPQLDLAGAAETLGVTEEALIAALGLPEAPPERPERPARSEQATKPEPDLAGAAATLGITEDELIAALGDPSQGRPDLAAVASALGITEDELVAALGLPERPEGGGGPQGEHEKPEIDFAAAALELGVTEEALIEALGIPEGGPEQGGPGGEGRGGPRGGRR